MPKGCKRFLPVYYLKMANELKKGTPRPQIANQLASKHGLNKEYIEQMLSKVFPKNKIHSEEDIANFLWKKRASIPSRYDTKKARSKARKKLWKNLSMEKRKEWIGRLAINRRKAKRSRRGPYKKWMVGKKTETREDNEKKRKKKQQALSAKTRTRMSMLSEEQKKAMGEKQRESRQRLTFGKYYFIKQLPELNLLSQKEKEEAFNRFQVLVKRRIKPFENRRDFDGIRESAYFGFSMALAKWDKKSDLEKLIKDSIEYYLIEYFAEEKGHRINEMLFEKTRG